MYYGKMEMKFKQDGKFIEARYQWNRALDLDPEEDQIEKIKVKLIKGY